ncbi:MAG: MBL fold metallo-hydrolase [Pseudomonadota bacterium]
MLEPPTVRLTRINNACALIEIGEHAILTDPYFINYKMVGINEPVGLSVTELPPITAIIGCHCVIDHWQMESLVDYKYNKDDVRVFVAMSKQARGARRAGFHRVEVLEWGAIRRLGDLSIRSVQAHKMAGMTVNNYALRLGDNTVFFGGEARDIAPLAAYRARHGEVDVALLPVNAVHLMGLVKLVMSGQEAVHATKILGARALFVIHDAHPDIPGVIRVRSSGDDAEAAAVSNDSPDVVRVPPGVTWAFDRAPTPRAHA